MNPIFENSTDAERILEERQRTRGRGYQYNVERFLDEICGGGFQDAWPATNNGGCAGQQVKTGEESALLNQSSSRKLANVILTLSARQDDPTVAVVSPFRGCAHLQMLSFPHCQITRRQIDFVDAIVSVACKLGLSASCAAAALAFNTFLAFNGPISAGATA